MKTAGVFVDITNQYYAALSARHGAAIDYEKYLAKAGEDVSIHRAFAYGVQMGQEASSFIAALKNLGYEPKYRQAITIGERKDIRRTDRNMLLAMDIWRCIDRLDLVILGSNDPDLSPLVLRIKELGVQTLVFSCNISKELKESVDRFLEIPQDIFQRKKESVTTE